MAPNHEIYLYDSIGYFGDDAKSVVIDQIKAAGEKPIDLHINSPGGSVFDGYAIYNALRSHLPGVNVYIDGLAASIASYIAMAGTRIYMAENALIMFHNPTSDLGGGDAEALRKQADLLDLTTNSIVGAYSRRSGMSTEQISEMMDNETWLTADMAKVMGFIDEITPELEMAASFDINQLSKFKHVPESLRKAGKQEKNMSPENNPIVVTPLESTPAGSPASSQTRPDGILPSDPIKPTLFQRVAAIVKEKSSLAELTAKHATEITAKDKEIADFKSAIANFTQQLSTCHSQLKAYEQAEAELKAELDKVTAENKASEDKAIDLVAAAGFAKNELPPPVDADAAQAAKDAAEPKDLDGWMDKYNAIKDPAAKQTFLRENETKIWAAREQARQATLNPATK